MKELARTSPSGKTYRVFLVGGGTAVQAGWRPSTIDVDLYCDRKELFRDIPGIKDRLQLNVEFVRPEDFVPALDGSANRHIFIQKVGSVTFYHYDPYAQLLSKVVRGFSRDLRDAESFLSTGMVDAERFRALVQQIPDAAYTRYPALSQQSVLGAVDDFLMHR